MGEFYINTRTITQQSKGLSDIKTAINSARGSVNSVKDGLDGIDLSILIPSVDAINEELKNDIKEAELLFTALTQAIMFYITVESKLLGIPLENNPLYLMLNSLGVEEPSWGEEILQKVPDGLINFVLDEFEKNIKYLFMPIDYSAYKFMAEDFFGLDKFEFSLFNFKNTPGFKFFNKYKKGVYKLKPGDDNNWLEKAFGIQGKNDEKHYIWNEKTNSMEKYDPKTSNYTDMKKVAELFSYDFVKTHYSVFENEGSFDWGNIQGKGEISLLNFDTNIRANINLYNYNSGGYNSLAIGGGGEASVSASILKANGELRTGNDYLGSYSKGEVTIGEVKAGVTADAGLFDSNEKFNPQIDVDVSAELKVGEVKVETGVRVFKTDIGVEYGVAYGVGGNINFGFKDGKFNFGTGVYGGFGNSINFKVDFSDSMEDLKYIYDSVSDNVSFTLGRHPGLTPW